MSDRPTTEQAVADARERVDAYARLLRGADPAYFDKAVELYAEAVRADERHRILAAGHAEDEARAVVAGRPRPEHEE